jgi:hypothetical protein
MLGHGVKQSLANRARPNQALRQRAVFAPWLPSTPVPFSAKVVESLRRPLSWRFSLTGDRRSEHAVLDPMVAVNRS